MKRTLFFLLAAFVFTCMTDVVKPVVADETPEIENKLPNQKATLNETSIDLGKPFFAKDDAPFVLYLRRTSYSPAKIDLRFKNNYRYCDKPTVGSLTGGVAIGCVLYMYNDIDEELSLDFKNLSKLKEGEEEMIELKIIKADINTPNYKVEAKSLTNANAQSEVNRKFFGGGFNVEFKMKDARDN